MNCPFPEIKKNFGFGMMRLPMIGEDVDLEATCRMVDVFLEAGFNYFDTAHPYIKGKSETAIELVKRGHRLIADDAVEIKRASAKALVGSAPEIIRHYVELRGIGIVDIRRLFGMGAVNDTEKIDLVINLEHWVQGKMYDRLGLDEQKTEILGIELPCITIPVKPGRNLAIILEIAAMNNRLKSMGYNTAEEFNKKLMSHMEAQIEGNNL